MAEKHPKRPRDPNQIAKLIVDIATSEAAEERADTPAPGSIGGKARASKLSPKRRSEIAKKAALKRWKATESQDES